MTIIVYRDGVLVADDLISHMPDGLFSGRTVKVAYRKKDKCLISGCGSLAEVENFIRLALKGKPGSATGGDYTGVIAHPDGTVEEWQNGSKCLLRGDYYAVGWGSTMAVGALSADVDAIRAAKIVCRNYGWPADLHAINHAGELSLIQRSEEPLHENARGAVVDWQSRFAEVVPGRKRRPRKAGRSNPKRNKRTKKPTPRRKR